MLTPHCAWRIGAGGLREPSTPLTYLRGDSHAVSLRETTVGRAPLHVLHRLHLTWGHDASDFALEAQHLPRPDLSALVNTSEGLGVQAKRAVTSLLRTIANGKPPVQEHWLRYPTAPIDPSYYIQLLATASSMSEEEQRARAMIEPRATPRGDHGGDEPATVTLDISDPTDLNPRLSEMVMQHV